MATSKKIITLMLIILVSVIGTGCSDDSTSPAPAAPPVEVVVDTAPPAVPANLSVMASSEAILLAWDQNTTDADLDGFIITREHLGVTEVLTDAPRNVAAFSDYDAQEGESVYYVYSVDFTGNESGMASVTYQSPRVRDISDLDIK